MANIANLARGASSDVTFTYTIKESDIGKTNLINTITASGGGASAVNINSPAVNVEAVRKTMTMTVSRTNNPADGAAYAKDEAVTWSIVIKNTGNQTLTNVAVTGNNGATVTNGTIASLGIGASSTLTGQYTIEQTDLGSKNLTITFTASGSGASVSQTTAVIPVKAAVPSSQDEFAALSWAEIKKMADDCAKNGADNYRSMLGFTKPVTFPEYGTVNMRLVSFNNKDKSDGTGKAGFCFESVEMLNARQMYTNNTTIRIWSLCSCKNFLANRFNTLSSDLQSVIAEVSNKCLSEPYNGGNTVPSIYTVNDKLWIPSLIEAVGPDYTGANKPSYIPQEGELFEWYKVHNTANDRIKNKNPVDGSATNVSCWWTRTPYKTSSEYKFFVIVNNGGLVQMMQNTSTLGVVPCFCI